MGGGSWTRDAFVTYATTTCRNVTADGNLDNRYNAQDLYRATRLAPELNPHGVIRECRDSDEHPETKPVILALDVTGSMGDSAAEVAKKLNEIMTSLYDQVKDVEFLIMGIGDLAYDAAPIQASQFESDIRIAEQLDKIYFEGGGGGNSFESYTAAWYFGLRHTDLDCWKRGKKGVIITMGDEPMNPYLPGRRLAEVTGDTVQGDIETNSLYDETIEKFDVYHLAVNDAHNSYRYHASRVKSSFGKYLDDDHLKVVTLNNIASAIVDIVDSSFSGDEAQKVNENSTVTETNEIKW